MFRTRTSLVTLILVLMLMLGCVNQPGEADPVNHPPGRPPNIVLILVDDLGWKDVGFMGSPYYETPHIDRLAHEGMVFTAAYANAPNCAPSRASLLTGQYTPRHGIYTVGTSKRGKARYRALIPIANQTILPRDKVTLAEALGAIGYVSASIGKWHLGGKGYLPTDQGFDRNVAGYEAGSPGPFGGYFPPWDNPYLTDGSPGEYLTDRLTEEALQFMDENQDRPFFLYLAHYGVHSPWQAQDSLIAKYEEKAGTSGQHNAVYAAMIESVDRSVGRILKKLDALELSENTVVIFFSDNGGHAKVTSIAPLRGSKGMLYEGGIRVPLVIKWPGVTEPGSTCETPVIGTDLFPTLLEITGAPRPEGQVLDGESLVPLLKGEQALEDRALFWHFPAYLQAYLPEQGHWRTTPAGAVRKSQWKLIEFFEDGRLELYNLREDIGEQHNLAQERPEKARELHRILVEWRQSIDAPVPMQANPAYDPAPPVDRLEDGDGAVREHRKNNSTAG